MVGCALGIKKHLLFLKEKEETLLLVTLMDLPLLLKQNYFNEKATQANKKSLYDFRKMAQISVRITICYMWFIGMKFGINEYFDDGYK